MSDDSKTPEFCWKKSGYESGLAVTAKLSASPELLFKRIGAFAEMYKFDVEIDADENGQQYGYQWTGFEAEEVEQESKYYERKFFITGYRTRGRPQIPVPLVDVIINESKEEVYFYYSYSQKEMAFSLYSYLIEQQAIGAGEEPPPAPAGEPGEALTKLEQGIIQAYEDLLFTLDRVTDDSISTWLAQSGIVNQAGNAYSREHINRTKNKLIDGGHLKM